MGLLKDEDAIVETDLTPAVKEIIRSAARKLTSFSRRQFQAEIALQYCDGKPRRAEEIFGWGRDAVRTGLGELRTGIRCLDNFNARGRQRTEDDHPEIAQQIHALVDPQAQADRQLLTPSATPASPLPLFTSILSSTRRGPIGTSPRPAPCRTF